MGTVSFVEEYELCKKSGLLLKHILTFRISIVKRTVCVSDLQNAGEC